LAYILRIICIFLARIWHIFIIYLAYFYNIFGIFLSYIWHTRICGGLGGIFVLFAVYSVFHTFGICLAYILHIFFMFLSYMCHILGVYLTVQEAGQFAGWSYQEKGRLKFILLTCMAGNFFFSFFLSFFRTVTAHRCFYGTALHFTSLHCTVVNCNTLFHI